MRRSTYITPYGNPKTAKIIIIGEQPSKQDVRFGKVFTGQQGKELDDCLMAAKILRSDCYMTYVIKDLDQPLNHYISFSPKGVTISSDGQEYINELGEELSQTTAKVIIAFGNVGLNAIADRYGITKWRGSILQSTLLSGKTVIPTFSPATLAFPQNQYLNKHCMIFDMKRAQSIISGEYKPTKRELITSPTFDDSMLFLQTCYDLGLNGQVINYDIEISNMEVSCISFSYDFISMCIPFIDGSGNYFTPEQEVELWLMMAKILEHPEIRKQGQNLTFDTHFLLRKFGIHAINIDDTMIKQRILMPDYKIGLDFITSIWTDLPYYKEDGKFWLEGVGSWERGWEYNAIDSIICSEAGPKQDEALIKQGNFDTYNRSRKIILPLVYMMEKGILIDVDQMAKDYVTQGLIIEEEEQKLNDMAGCQLNAKSPKQLCDFFYKQLHIKPYKEKGKVTTNELALKRISRLGYKEASQILKIRRLTKERSTYLDVTKVDSDKRMRCSYNPAGTRYSRISSSKTLFGTGNNLQNQPHKILKYYKFDPGYIGYEIDLGQAENRIVAYVGRVSPMIDAFETGKDVHSLTGGLICGKTPEEVKYENDQFGLTNDLKYCSPLGNGDKTWRFWGKKANHGLNYDLGYKNFALRYEIPESAGKIIVDRYHQVYPGVRQNFHAHVKQCLMKNRTLTNLLGRRTLFMGDLSNERERDKVFKEAYACIPQGTVGDLINNNGLNYIYYNPLFEPIQLSMTVHDSIKFQIPLMYGWHYHAQLLLLIKNNLEQPLTTHYGRKFVIPADISIGYNMGNMLELKGDQVGRTASDLASKLEELEGKLRMM
jgi:uracil-DNA glycosylase family 4